MTGPSCKMLLGQEVSEANVLDPSDRAFLLGCSLQIHPDIGGCVVTSDIGGTVTSTYVVGVHHYIGCIGHRWSTTYV